MHLDIATPGGPATAELDRPRGSRALLVLTHGAAGGVDTVDLLAIAATAVRAGIAVARVTQPYRVAGRRAPPVAQAQDAAWLAVVTALRRRVHAVPVFVGGRSNGARVACRTANGSGAAAVVALAFPLHPPGRPERSRLAELQLPTVPVLVVQGDRDPFGMPPAGAGRDIVVVPGADHSLRKGTAATAQTVVEFVTSVLARANLST